MCTLVEGETEVGAESGLLRLTIPYTKGPNLPYAWDYLLTPHQAMKLAAQLNEMALMMVDPTGNVAVMKKRAVTHG